jgi:hypothetical protein
MLTTEQLRRFASDGYIVVRNAIPENFLLSLDHEIDELIASDPPGPDVRGAHSYALPPEQLPASEAALRDSGGLRTAEELVAPHTLSHGLNHIQVSLNIPPYHHRPGGPHLDGHRPQQKEPFSFTMLAAIYLVDETKEDSGNLWVWPGSHLRHQRLFSEEGVGVLLAVSGHPTMLTPRVEFDVEPTPIFANRGDLLLAHYLLGHNIGGNVRDNVRRVVYYRLQADGHRSRWSETFIDVFREYEPVRIGMEAAGS